MTCRELRCFRVAAWQQNPHRPQSSEENICTQAESFRKLEYVKTASQRGFERYGAMSAGLIL
jgi:hypothetical protein